jgi:hypothetical protein
VGRILLEEVRRVDQPARYGGLIAAADAALYRAKGAGKNCSQQAAASEQPSWAGAAQGEPGERRT